MAIEIGNALYAACFVDPTVDPPIFIGQSNVGFAPFGSGPGFSERVSPGQIRMHLLQPIAIVDKGEGIALYNVFGQGSDAFPPGGREIQATGSDSGADIFVSTFIGGAPTDVPFELVILRLPQQSTSST